MNSSTLETSRVLELSWAIAPCASDNIPGGRVRTVFGRTKSHLRVIAVHIGIPGNDGAAARSDEVADGAVVFDWNEDDELLGIEFLENPASEDVMHTLGAYLRVQVPEAARPLVLVIWATSLRTWERVQVVLNLIQELDRKGLPRPEIQKQLREEIKRLYRKADPNAKKWESPARAPRIAEPAAS